MLRSAALALLTFNLLRAADSPEQDAVIATVQRLFDAMAAHDADAARSVGLPDARYIAIHPDGAVTTSTHAQFAERVGGAKEAWLERMWSPKVQVDGPLATLWASYDFHRAGVFSHCGVDSIQLVKTEGTWKIAGVFYTMRTSGCAPSPLGPVK